MSAAAEAASPWAVQPPNTRAVVSFKPSIDGLFAVDVGDPVIVLATNADGYAFVCREPIGAEFATESGVLPVNCLEFEGDATTRAVRASTEDLSTPSSDAAAGGDPVALRLERLTKQWRAQLIDAVAHNAEPTVTRLANSVSQVSEWRRLKTEADSHAADATSYARISAAVQESLLQLVDANSQVGRSVLVPRTSSDEVATEANCSGMELLRLHVETELRLQRGIDVPSQASQSVLADIAKGLHGGPTVSNERATDVSASSMLVAALQPPAAAGAGSGGASSSGPAGTSTASGIAAGAALAGTAAAGISMPSTASVGGIAGGASTGAAGAAASSTAAATAAARTQRIAVAGVGPLAVGSVIVPPSSDSHGDAASTGGAGFPPTPLEATAAALRSESLGRFGDHGTGARRTPYAAPAASSATVPPLGSVAFPPVTPPQSSQLGLMQLLIDIDVLRGMQAFRQPGELCINVYDALNHRFLHTDAKVVIDGTGRPVNIGGKAHTAAAQRRRDGGGATGAAAAGAATYSPQWCQAMFINVPTQLVASGKAYLVFRLFRRGPLTDAAAAAAAIAMTAQSQHAPQSTAALAGRRRESFGPRAASSAALLLGPGDATGSVGGSRTASFDVTGLDARGSMDSTAHQRRASRVSLAMAGGGVSGSPTTAADLGLEAADMIGIVDDDGDVMDDDRSDPGRLLQLDADVDGFDDSAPVMLREGSAVSMAAGGSRIPAPRRTSSLGPSAVGTAASAGAAGATAKDGGSPSSASASGTAAPASGIGGMFSSLFARRRTDNATYLRPVGVAVMLVPPILSRLSDGTPHKPELPITLQRPAKAEESRFFSMHAALIAQAEIEREGSEELARRLASSGAAGAAAGVDGKAPAGASGPDSARGGVASSGPAEGGGGGSSALDGFGLMSTLTGRGTSTATSSAAAAAEAAAQQFAAIERLQPFPVVLRAFSALHHATLSDARYAHLFSPRVSGGWAARPMYWLWSASNASLLSPTLGSPALSAPGGDATELARSVTAGGMAVPSKAAKVMGLPATYGVPSTPRPAGAGLHATTGSDAISSPVLGGMRQPLLADGAKDGDADRAAFHPVVVSSMALLGPSTGEPRRGARGADGTRAPSDSTALRERDELIIVLRKGAFSQDTKLSARNVQVRAHVVLDDCAVLPCFIRGVFADGSPSGTGETRYGEHRSCVYYHCNNPQLDETLVIRIPSSDQLQRAHLLLTFWHASSEETKTHMFSFAFMPLTASDGTVVRDGRHVLRCYKPLPGMQAGINSPWYLVAPVVDGNGQEISSIAQLPLGCAPPSDAPQYDDESAMQPEPPAGTSTALVKPGDQPVYKYIAREHVASARSRNLPTSAVPTSITGAVVGVAASRALYPRGMAPLRSASLAPGDGMRSIIDRSASIADFPASAGAFSAGAASGADSLMSPAGRNEGGFVPTSSSSAVVGGSGRLRTMSDKDGAGTPSRATFIVGATRATDAAKPAATVGWSSSALRSTTGARSAVAGLASRMSSALFGGADGSGENAPLLASSSGTAGSAPATSEDSGKPTPFLLQRKGADTEKVPCVELRKDSFEIETLLVSDARANVPEIRVLSEWETSSQDDLVAALSAVPKLLRDTSLLAKHFALVMRSLTALIEAQPAPVVDVGVRDVAAEPGGDRSQRRYKLLVLALRCMVSVLDRYFSNIRPAVAVGRRGAADSGNDDDTVPLMGPALPAEFAKLGLFDQFLSRGFTASKLHTVLLPCLLGVLQAAAAGEALDVAAEVEETRRSFSESASPSVASAASAAFGSPGGTDSASDPQKFGLPGRSMLQALRTMDLLVALCARSFVLDTACTPPADTPDLVASFRARMAALFSGILRILQGEHEDEPPWMLVAKCAALRHLGPIVAQCTAFLLAEERADILRTALAAVPLMSSITAEGRDTSPLSVRLAQLMLVRDVFRLDLLEALPPSQRRKLLPVLTQVLIAALNCNTFFRSMSMRLLPALLGHFPPPSTLVADTTAHRWPLTALLFELATAIYDMLQGRRARESLARGTGASGSNRSQHWARELMGELLGVALPSKAHHMHGGHAATASAGTPQIELDCRAVQADLHAELLGKSGRAALDEVLSLHVAEVRIGVTALCAILNALPQGYMPYLLATASPMQHYAPAEHAQQLNPTLRTAMCLQLCRTFLALLSAQIFPPSWLIMKGMLDGSAMKLQHWVGALLGACHRDLPNRHSPSLYSGTLRLWRAFIDLSTALITSPTISLERLASDRRAFVLRTFGDQRSRVCDTFRMCWGSFLAVDGISPEFAATSAYQDCTGEAALKLATTLSGGGEAAPDDREPLSPRLRLHLAAYLVGPCLDLTHSHHAAFAALARDVYFDLIRAELVSRYGEDVEDFSADQLVTGASPLPLIERLTIDAIDTLVRRRGPSFAAVQSMRLSASLDHASATTADASSSSYVPPAENLIMSLFAVRRTTTTTTTAGAAGGAGVPPTATSPPSVAPASFAAGACDESTAAAGAASTALTAIGAFSAMLDHALVVQFLREIRTLYAMLSSVSRYPATPSFEDERVEGAMTLVNYLRRTHRTDIYMKYVHFLHQLHSQLGNKAEAAMSYLLYADILTWSPQQLGAFYVEDLAIFPAQSAAARLEQVLLRTVDDLVEASCWEEASRVVTILLQRYEHVTFELTKAAALWRRAASLSDAIAHKERLYTSYFFVKFSGEGAPAACRNELYVYRGALGERLGDFESRIVEKWSGAKKIPLKIDSMPVAGAGAAARDGAKTPAHPHHAAAHGVKPPTSPAFEIAMAGAQTVPFVPVHPIYDPRDWLALHAVGSSAVDGTAAELTSPTDADAAKDWVALATGQGPNGGRIDMVTVGGLSAGASAVGAPQLVREGRYNSGARCFVHSRPFRKRATKTSNEFLDSWASRCYVAVETAFPSTSRRQRVFCCHEIALNPVEVAVLMMQEKCDALVDVIERAAAGPDRSASQDFSQKLQGVVDAAVSGGIANYRSFFTGAFKTTHPEIQEDIDADASGQKASVFDALRESLVQLLFVVARGIRVHGVKCSEALLPLHEHLCIRFDAMKQVLREMGAYLPGDTAPAVSGGAAATRALA